MRVCPVHGGAVLGEKCSGITAPLEMIIFIA
jgi:hypothetical protein